MPPDPVLPGAPPEGGTPPPCPTAVIDTNVWLDLYWFADPSARPLRAALEQGRLLALSSAAMRAELRAVLARPQFCRSGLEDAGARRSDARPGSTPARGAAGGPQRGHSTEADLASWDALARACEAQQGAPWSCRDPDDQKFLDLAFSARAQWLLTKDRALLDLARKARAAGICITDPRGFATMQAPAPQRPPTLGGVAPATDA